MNTTIKPIFIPKLIGEDRDLALSILSSMLVIIYDPEFIRDHPRCEDILDGFFYALEKFPSNLFTFDAHYFSPIYSWIRGMALEGEHWDFESYFSRKSLELGHPYSDIAETDCRYLIESYNDGDLESLLDNSRILHENITVQKLRFVPELIALQLKGVKSCHLPEAPNTPLSLIHI